MALEGKVAVVTGATSGIGEATALALASQGARLLIVARDGERAAATLARLGEAGPDAAHAAVIADLSLCAETRRAGAEIAALAPRIDVLINNAGALFDRRDVTAEGLDRTFALNHMAYFVLTEALTPNLVAAGDARIISTASSSHSHARLDFDDLQNRGRSGLAQAYARSKLCNLLWTRELARRLAGTGVTANAFHPGVVATRIGHQAGGFVRGVFKIAQVFARRPQAGADCAVFLATSPEVAGLTGGYWVDRKRVQPSAAARDDADGRRLWAASEDLLARISRGERP